MSSLARLALLLVGLGVPVLAPGVALGCVNDAECNDGDTCSQPDLCMAGTCLYGGGGDGDANLICDDEFAPGVDLRVTRLRIKVPAIPNRGGVRGMGDFIDLGSPGGAFTGNEGIAIRVKDALSDVPPPSDGIDLTMTFAPGDCTTDTKGVSCLRDGGPSARSIARFRRNRLAPEQVRVSFLLRGLDLTRPFFGPIRVIISHNTDVHRLGQVTDCKLLGKGINCREF